MGKLFGSALRPGLMHMLSVFIEVRAEGQAGFRKGRSTIPVDHVFVLRHLLGHTQFYSGAARLYLCYVDLSKGG